MSKYEKTVVGLLVAISLFSGVTAVEVARIARIGFEVELTPEEAEEIASEASEAIEARGQAAKDMEGECYVGE